MVLGPLAIVLTLAGIAIGVVTNLRAVDALAIGVALASFALIAPELVAAARQAVCRRGVLLAAITAVAAAHGAHARDGVLRSPILVWLDAKGETDPRTAEPVLLRGTLLSDASPRETGVRLEIRVHAIDDGEGWRRIDGRVQAHVSGTLASSQLAAWTAGRRIEAPLTLRRPSPYHNPGGESPAWQARRRPFDLLGTIKSATLIRVERGPPWHEAAAALRRHIRDAAARYLAPGDPEAAAIVTAILIGDRAGLSADVEQRLQAAGTYHVIAISGGNIALLVMTTLCLTRLLSRSRFVSSLTTLGVVVVYGWIVGGDPSVRRAVLAASVYLIVDLIGWVPGAIRVLGLVGLIVCAVDPLTIIDVGAWLSFGATMAIVLGAQRLAAGVPVRTPLLRPIALIGAATVAAELALMPIQAQVFNRVSIAGLMLNFVAIPAMAVVQICGALLVVCAGWWNSGAVIMATGATAASRALVDSTMVVTMAPWLSWRMSSSAVGWSVAYYLAWTVLISARAGPSMRRVASVVVVVTLLKISAVPLVSWRRPPPPWLRVTMIDVGQGDAILVQFPSGHAMLVDTGGTPGGFDIGGRVVTPAVWALGVTRLDWLVLTHGDGDHAGGAVSVVRDLWPREVWEGVPVPGHRQLAVVRTEATAVGAIWRQVAAGQTIDVGRVRVRAVHPVTPDWERRTVRNDDSVVLSIEYGDVQVLLTGDAAMEFEEGRGLVGGDVPSLRVLKVAHHGSRTSSSANFLAAYRPDVALVSVGRGNLFGHPAADVVNRLEMAQADLFRTDRHGAVTIEIDGRRVRVKTMSGKRWEVMRARTAS